MNSLGLISQTLIIGLSVAIVFLYIRPAFQEIGSVQEQIDEYGTQRQKIEQVNAELEQRVAISESINPRNLERLRTYMPKFVDDIAVMRDLEFIAEEAGVVLDTISYDGSGDSDRERGEDDGLGDLAPTPHDFSLSVTGTYSQIKTLFSLLEQNEYPLEVWSASIAPLSGGFLGADIEVVTYADEEVPLPAINN